MAAKRSRTLATRTADHYPAVVPAVAEANLANMSPNVLYVDAGGRRRAVRNSEALSKAITSTTSTYQQTLCGGSKFKLAWIEIRPAWIEFSLCMSGRRPMEHVSVETFTRPLISSPAGTQRIHIGTLENSTASLLDH